VDAIIGRLTPFLPSLFRCLPAPHSLPAEALAQAGAFRN
jgi:hypothetical protein